MNEELIEKTIKREQLKKLILPLLFIGILIDIIFLSDFSKIINPVKIGDINLSSDVFSKGDYKNQYINTTLDKLYYTGLTKESKDEKSYIYASIKDDSFFFVILSPKILSKYTSNKSLKDTNIPQIMEDVNITAKIKDSKELDSTIYKGIEENINWSGGNLIHMTGNYYLEECTNIILKLHDILKLIIAFAAISVIYIIYTLIIFFIPYYHSGLKPLKKYGDIKSTVKDADLELIDNVRDYKNSTFITEHYYVRLKSGSIKVKKL